MYHLCLEFHCSLTGKKTGLKRFLAPLPHGMSQNCAWYLNQSNVKSIFSICQQNHKKYLDQVDVECENGSKVVWNLVGLNFGAILGPEIIRSTNDLM